MKKLYDQNRKRILYAALLIQIVLITGIIFYDEQKVQNNPDNLSILLWGNSVSIIITVLLYFTFAISLFMFCCAYSATRTQEREIAKSLEQTINCIVPVTTVVMCAYPLF